MSNNDELEEKITYKKRFTYKKECLDCGYTVKEISKKMKMGFQDFFSKCPKCGNYLIVIEIGFYIKRTSSVGDTYLLKELIDEARLKKFGLYDIYKEALNIDLKYGKRCFYEDFILKYNGKEIEITEYTRYTREEEDRIVNIPAEINGFPVTKISCRFDFQDYVNLPDSLTEIGNETFLFSSIKEINFPNSLIKIGSSAFRNCHELTKVDFPNSIKIIEDYAFYDCRNIKNLYIPDSVEKIGEQAFYLIDFEEVSIPSTLTDIGENAFLDFINIVRRK